MRGIGRMALQTAAELVAEIVHQFGVPANALRGGHVLDINLAPQTIGATKGIDAGFRRNACPGQNDNIFKVTNAGFTHGLVSRFQKVFRF